MNLNLFALASLFTVILFEHHLSAGLKTGFILFTLLTLINCGAIMEQKKWVFYLEFSRLFLTTMGLLLIYPASLLVPVLTAAFAGVLYFTKPLKQYYLQTIYPNRKNE